MTATGNDYLTTTLFTIVALAIGVISAMFAIFLVQFGPKDWSKGASSAEVVAGLVCGAGGFAIASIVFALVSGANKATLILFAARVSVPCVTLYSFISLDLSGRRKIHIFLNTFTQTISKGSPRCGRCSERKYRTTPIRVKASSETYRISEKGHAINLTLGGK